MNEERCFLQTTLYLPLSLIQPCRTTIDWTPKLLSAQEFNKCLRAYDEGVPELLYQSLQVLTWS